MTNMRVHLDYTQLRELAIDLSGAPMRVQFNARKGLRESSKIVDQQMTIDATGHQGNWFGIPGTEYDTPLEKHVSWEFIGDLQTEIGIEAKGAGLLAPIIVFGSVNNDPTYDHTAALRRSMPAILNIFGRQAQDATLTRQHTRGAP